MEKVNELFDKKLGFGCMRLPLLENGKVDYPQFEKMIDIFLERGFKYFDTAYPYLNHQSEVAVRECLVKRYPRDRFLLATKMPLWNVAKEEDLERLFNEQLANTGVEYFDLYLLHCLTDETFPVAEKFDAFSFVQRKKQEGKIRHIGFSFHNTADKLDEILTKHPEVEFVQLQINYYDWDSENVQSRKCYEVACKHHKPVIVMEPVKGGSLVTLTEKSVGMLKQLDANASTASYAVRYAASLESVMMVLSGMSNIAQLEDNTSFMQDFKPLTKEEYAVIDKVVEDLNSKKQIPCTACRYCTENCPMQIPIPDVINILNKYYRFAKKDSYNEIVKGRGKASDCIKCGQCESKCPQHIKIREVLKEATKAFE